MFRSSRWRSEKNKIKVVFKLQFHATQVRQVGIDALMMSVVPADVGKPTAKLEKVAVLDGSCYWENPVLETVKFELDVKSGKVHERIYRFVVATGSSKAGVIGETSIDFSNYADATKASSVSLSLKNPKSEILLHVSIQKLKDTVDQRQFGESEILKDNFQDRNLRGRQLSNGDMDNGNNITNTIEDGTFNKKVPQNGVLNLNRRNSSGSDVTMSSSDCSSVPDTPTELQLKNRIYQDSSNLPFSVNHDSGPMTHSSDGALAIICDEPPNPKWGWLGVSVVDMNTDDSSGTPREALQRTNFQEELDTVVVEKLKAELTALARQAEVSDLELQTLRKQIVKEGKRGQDLSKEVVSLKKERDSLREDCIKLKGFQKHLDEAKSKHMSQLDGGDFRALMEELRQELHYEKDLNANLRIQLQKTQESNSELLLAVHDLDEMLEEKCQETLHLTSNSGTENTQNKREANSKCETDDDEEQKALEQLVREHSDAKNLYMMEQRIMDLNSEIEIYRREKDELEVHTEQLALDYEILKQEHHDMSYKLEQSQRQERLKVQYELTSSHATVTALQSQIEKLENKLKKQEQECSESLSTISELEIYVKDFEEELEKQAHGFEADLEALTRDKVEQEQRAIKAEESLRKTRWQNANTAERLQGELRRLSMQMSSTFVANEKLATKAMMEARELRLEKDNIRNMLQKSRDELESVKDHYEERLHELSNQVISLSARLGEMQTEIQDKSMKLDTQENLAEETHRLLSEDILVLKDDIEILSKQNKFLSEQADKSERLNAELECMQKSIIEKEMLIEQQNKERVELENKAIMMKKEAAQSLEEINNMRLLKDEKEVMLTKLRGQVETLEAQCDELRCSRHGDELEKEQLLKQVSQLKADMAKKQDALKSIEKKLKDHDRKTAASDIVRTIQKSNKSVMVPYGAKEIGHLKEKIRLLEGQIKMKEVALETSTNSFLEKEKELQNQIEDLAKTLEVLSGESISFSKYKSGKIAEEERSVYDNGIAVACTSSENNCRHSSPDSNDVTNERPKAYAANERNVDKLAGEVAQLKERNKLMEDELKEMQERYSEISLKFAEVEGERQQLVMRVRNLKNTKKS